MHRAVRARHGIAALSTAAASLACGLPESQDGRRVCQCEGAPSSSNRPFRVLVVGAGLTGCLAALRIRQRSEDLARPVDVAVVERASYPSGRFGAAATYRGCIADIGAQVLSTLNVDDYRALGGHGVEVKDIRLASDLVQRLVSDEMLVRARDDVLGETEERMLWEGLWQHYFAPDGMVSVLHKLLAWARISPLFGVRIDSIDTRTTEGTVLVKGVSRRRGQTDEEYCQSYDSVVLCIPAPNVMFIEGALDDLSADSRHVLKRVGYDERTCEAHFFSDEMSHSLVEAFGGKVELMVEDINESIQYISWQNRKSEKRSCADDNGPIALVVHSQTGQLHPLGDALDRTLSKLTGMRPDEIASHRLYSKSIAWDVSQLTTPMEAVVADPPSPAWQCIASDDRRVILAGDFMTQSSFLGCVASADAAARAVMEAATSHFADKPKQGVPEKFTVAQ